MNGNITISRTTSNHGDDKIVIYFQDEISRVRFLTATMSLKDFALAVTNLSNQPCEFELNPTNVGKKKVIKKVKIFVKDFCKAKPEDLAEFTSEGWEFHDNDLWNHQNYTKVDNGYHCSVRLFRWEDDNGS